MRNSAKEIKEGQNRLHDSIPQCQIKKSVKFAYIWCTTKRFLALCCKNWKIDESLGITNFIEISLYYLITVCSWIFI